MGTPGHPAAGKGELVAIDRAPGPAWLDLVADLWWRGVAFLPLDRRLTNSERSHVLEVARPTSVLTDEGEELFTGDPVDERVGAVVATSGTGGRPRLVELSRDALTEAVQSSAAMLGDAGDRRPWISCLTPAHVGGLLVLLRGAILDAPVTVHDRFEPSRLSSDAAGGTCVSVVPTMVRRLVDHGEPLDGLTLLVGGARLEPDLADAARARGADVITTYGLTETCGGVAYDGDLFPGTSGRIDAEGRIELRGPTLMEGYRANPAATGAAFTVDGWLRTNDLGLIASDGRLEVHGRADDAIRSGGETIWPDEVEAVLAPHRGVRDVAVVGRPDEEWGSHVTAFVVPERLDDPPTLEELREFARDRLARFKLPRELHLVPELPRTPSGKVRRGSLR